VVVLGKSSAAAVTVGRELMTTLTEHQVVELTQPVDKDEVLTRKPGEPRGIGQ
jgi:hypothetical protein